jgi:3-methyladenine DNA glycosylase AlkD
MDENIIQDIRKRCRMAMNGIVSTSMRRRGLNYKLNFGLSIQQIKDLSKRYQPDAALAEILWKEDTRELKILAALLYPTSSFTKEMADKWVCEIPNQEIREQLCANLFQNLPFANELVLTWENSAETEIRTTGYWLLARLFLTNKIGKAVHTDSLSFLWDDIISENIFLRNASLLALKHIVRQSEDIANQILQRLSVYKEDEDLIKQEAFNSMAFEFDYYFPIQYLNPM